MNLMIFRVICYTMSYLHSAGSSWLSSISTDPRNPRSARFTGLKWGPGCSSTGKLQSSLTLGWCNPITWWKKSGKNPWVWWCLVIVVTSTTMAWPQQACHASMTPLAPIQLMAIHASTVGSSPCAQIRHPTLGRSKWWGDVTKTCIIHRKMIGIS